MGISLILHLRNILSFQLKKRITLASLDGISCKRIPELSFKISKIDVIQGRFYYLTLVCLKP